MDRSLRQRSLLEYSLLEPIFDVERLFLVIAARYPNVFWLDRGPAEPSGVSLLGFGELTLEAERGGEVEFLAELERGFGSQLANGLVGEDNPQPSVLSGGWIVWLSHEFGVGPDRNRTPIGWALAPSAWLEVDHASGNCRLFGIDSASLNNMVTLLTENTPHGEKRGGSDFGVRVKWRDDRCEFRDKVKLAAEGTRDKTFEVICLTNSLLVRGFSVSAKNYCRLRHSLSTGYGGFLRFGAQSMISFTPEQFFLVEAGGRIVVEPMKGTAWRPRDPQADAASAQALRCSAKELAENRSVCNEVAQSLAGICHPNSVRISKPVIRSFPHVHQLVGQVSGMLQVPPTAALAKLMPPASMVGNPKETAFLAVRQLEEEPRGLYSGCFGYLSPRGTADLRVTIRSIIQESGRVSIGVGAGITAASNVDEEVDETWMKAEPLLRGLGDQR